MLSHSKLVELRTIVGKGLCALRHRHGTDLQSCIISHPAILLGYWLQAREQL